MDRTFCSGCGCEILAVPSGNWCPACLLATGDCDEGWLDSEGYDFHEITGPRPMVDDTSHIGPYHLLRVLGEGGMGTVYLAEQHKPIRRSVALKLVRTGLGNPETLRRFEEERRNLSRMEHHGIARVLDAGETTSGQPYFVMELVEGNPLTEYCDSHCLGIDDRLKLFLQVCEAVEHAHRKGVIHRDLKPSNLLVAGASSGPKVIDFGIAKAMGDDVAETLALTLATGLGQILGTPQYMSPEQAASDPPDTRTDVYGLGAVLYELLAGSSPLRRERLRDISLAEILRLVREEEPERPSARFDALPSEARKEVASCRGETPESWLRQLRGDLDWIVLRAVEKEPDRRYPSVAALSADLERFLGDEPVDARPPSRLYRIRKFVRRNRAFTSSVAAIATVLVAATVVSVRWALEAGEARRLAESRLAQADAVPDFLIKAFRRADPTVGSRDLLAVEVLDQAVIGADTEFSEQPLMRARIFEALAQTYLRLGFYEKADALVDSAGEAARLVSKEDPELHHRLVHILSETRRLERRMGEAVEMSEKNWREVQAAIGTGSDEEMRARNEWNTNLINAGELDRAEAALEEARALADSDSTIKEIDFQGLYASLHWAQGRHEEAHEGMAKRLAQYGSSYLTSSHDLMWKIRHFSGLLFEMGRVAEAEAWSEALVRCTAEVYGIDHHLTMEAVAIRARCLARRGSGDAAYFILRLASHEASARNPAAPGLARLNQHLSAARPHAPLAGSIDSWMEGSGSMNEPPPPLHLDPAIGVALSDHQSRTGMSDQALLTAGQAHSLSLSQFSASDPRLTVRTARLIELFCQADQRAGAESLITDHWSPGLLEPPTGRFLLDACEMLITRLNEAGEQTLANQLDRKYLLPALIPRAASMKSGRLSHSYHRIEKTLRGEKYHEDRMRFHEMMSSAVQASLPISDPFRRLIQIRKCELLIAERSIEKARVHFNVFKKGIESVNESAGIVPRLDLSILESKLLRAEGNHLQAEELLLTSWNTAKNGSLSGMPIGENTKNEILQRLDIELQYHYKAIGDEASKLKWTQSVLLEKLIDGHDEEVRAWILEDDLTGLLGWLEKENIQSLTTEKTQKSLQLAEWLADELEARKEPGLSARAAMGALRRHLQIGEATAGELRLRFQQVQRGLLALPSPEARAGQLSEIEKIFAGLLGPRDLHTWIVRSHRLVFLHTTATANENLPLIEAYFEAFPDEERDRSVLRLWFHNHLARSLLDLGEMANANARLETAQSLSLALDGESGILESDLRGARIMMSNLFARFHHEMQNHELEQLWLKQKADLEAEK